MVGHCDCAYQIAQILDFKTVVGIEVQSVKVVFGGRFNGVTLK
jgi:hypothetical protein